MSQIHEVFSVTKTVDGALSIDADFTGVSNGERMRAEYILRDGDEFGSAPMFRQWVADNSPKILPYTPPPEPTPEELRAQMPPLTPRQFRDALIDHDIMPDSVTAAISQIADVKERAKALNAWEYPTQFVRTEPLIEQIGAIFNLTPEDIDDMWQAAIVG